MSYSFNDNTDEVLNAMRGSIGRALTRIGLSAEGYAKKECPVDTGNLRNSITHEVVQSEKAVHIGTNVEYAPYVEMGTTNTKAQPYLKPAIADHIQEYKSIIEQELK